MATAKIITNGNTRMVVLPDNVLTDCDEVDIEQSGSKITLAPKKESVMCRELIDILCGFDKDVADAIIEARKNEIPSKREEL